MAKIRNTDRRTGKAYKKNRDAPVKVLSVEAQMAKAEKDNRRSKVARGIGGSNITLPKITWDWAGEMMYRRWPNSRKLRTLDAYIERNRGGKRIDDIPVIETNSEPKVSSAKPSRKAVARAASDSRKNGR